MLARDVDIIRPEECERLKDQATEVQRMLRGLIKRVKGSEPEQEPERNAS
jgi:hypothetical protein